jgi:hypothetical protein
MTAQQETGVGTDLIGATVVPGAIVAIIDPECRFYRQAGIVLDFNSDLNAEDGPIAIFFDQEVPDYEFNHQLIRDWDETIPTPKNYRTCPRVMTFTCDEIVVIGAFPVKTLINRKFGTNYNAYYSLPFPLVPHTHECQIKNCVDGARATHMTFANVWGSIMQVYTCEKCHKEWDTKRVDDVEIKKPLPGAPLIGGRKKLAEEAHFSVDDPRLVLEQP